jgi:N-acetylglutamate synthase-like GNAT family acetyltransferase
MSPSRSNMYKAEVAQNEHDLRQILELRYLVLRKPWQQPAETATDGREGDSVNVFIRVQEKVIACGRLQENENKCGQIRFMAVHPEFRGKGLGKIILARLERAATEMKISRIELQARENALDFYIRCGYTMKEKTFLLWGQIQHYLMEKIL